MEKLKAGDLFIVYSSELKYANLTSNGSFVLGNINVLEDYDFPLTTFMCKYLGNNLCEEYYSGIKMQINNPINEDEYYISIYDKHNSRRSFKDVVDKWKDFNKLDEYVSNYPLIIEPIIIHDVNQYVVCKDNSKENTINVINWLNVIAKNTYSKSKKKYIEEQYNQAFVEDMKINFQKRKKYE